MVTHPSSSRITKRSASGFSLVELLTVIVIIGILATLLSTGLTSAKRKARQASCTGNLRQISLAIDMFLDDQRERPTNFAVLALSKYLSNTNSFRCPEDKTSGWGSLVEAPMTISLPDTVEFDPETHTASFFMPYSYLSPLGWGNEAWDRLIRLDSLAGVAACQLHGTRRREAPFPTMLAYEGLLLRAQRDGAVVRRQLFWRSNGRSFMEVGDALNVNPSSATSEGFLGGTYPWELFSDLPESK